MKQEKLSYDIELKSETIDALQNLGATIGESVKKIDAALSEMRAACDAFTEEVKKHSVEIVEK